MYQSRVHAVARTKSAGPPTNKRIWYGVLSYHFSSCGSSLALGGLEFVISAFLPFPEAASITV
jgi:hypothetical protein